VYQHAKPYFDTKLMIDSTKWDALFITHFFNCSVIVCENGPTDLHKKWAEKESRAVNMSCSTMNRKQSAYRHRTHASSKYTCHLFIQSNVRWTTAVFANAPARWRHAARSYKSRREIDFSNRMHLFHGTLLGPRCRQIVWLQACQRKATPAKRRRPIPAWELLGNFALLNNCRSALCQAAAYWLNDI